MRNPIKSFIIFLTGASLCATSCGLLMSEPISEIPAGKMWKNERDVNAGIAEIYSSFRTAMRSNWFSWGEMRSDNFVLARELPSEFTYLISNQMSTDLESTNWTSLYKVISNTNFAIKYIPDAEITDQALKNDYLAQAYAMRALCYFYAVRVWGAVPVYLEPVEDISNVTVHGRTDRDKVLREVILPDLEMAEDLINPANVERKRLNRSAIYTIKADVLMWLGEWDAAGQALDLFMSINPLEASSSTIRFQSDINLLKNQFVNDLNNVPGNNNPTVDEYGDNNEFIFVIHQNYIEAGLNNYSWIWKVLGCGRGQGSDVVLSPKLQKIYQNSIAQTPADKRFANYLCESTSAAETFQVHKYMANGISVKYQDVINCQVAYPVYRYTDVLFMKAEVLAHQSQWGQALNQIGYVLERAGVESRLAKESDFASLDEVLNYILDQKQIEQVGEGKRWFDLVKYHKAVEVMGPINGMSKQEQELFPIHQSVLNLCQGAYEQNPGY